MQHTLLHITDCHLVPQGERLLGADTHSNLQAVLQQACAEVQPDAVVATGDLVHGGISELYPQLQHILRSFTDAPLLCMPGNHDCGEAMVQAGLPMEPLALGPWTVFALDSHEDDQPAAKVDDVERAALLTCWQSTKSEYGLLATHHPLLPIGSPWLDKDRISAPEDFLNELIDLAGPKFCGAIFGHVHQVVHGHYRRRPLLGTPSTGFQFPPRSQQFAVGERTPGYRWLTLGDDGQINSRVQWLH